MAYKDYEKQKANSLKRYYEKKEEILTYQKERLRKKYQTDEKFKAKRKLRDRSRVGKKAITVPCSKCNSKYDLQRHHPTYNSTDYIVLCRSCHNQLHQELHSIRLEVAS